MHARVPLQRELQELQGFSHESGFLKSIELTSSAILTILDHEHNWRINWSIAAICIYTLLRENRSLNHRLARHPGRACFSFSFFC